MENSILDQFNVQDSFNKELPSDPNLNNTRRQVLEACYSFVEPRIPSNPSLIHTSDELIKTLGLSDTIKDSKAFLNLMSGKTTLTGTKPYAMCYGGHQFGHWAGQLGDGRAINLFEITHQNKRWALQLKGAGATPYSRTADGLAVLRSSIREHLCSEAMYHLGVPTTRSLALSLTGDEVLRDMLYDGNSAFEKGAVVCRVAPSFIRFGNFQIFAARQDEKNLKKLADYTIKHFYPSIQSTGTEKYIDLFTAVMKRSLEVVVHWQKVGFVHGVMNTDNMSILGLTIDYGPYGWLENYDENWTPNTTDSQGKRYRFGQQPNIILWNLLQLANALYILVKDPKPFEEQLTYYRNNYGIQYVQMMRKKLGLFEIDEMDGLLIKNLNNLLQITETDMTIFFRNLSQITSKSALTDDVQSLESIIDAFYNTHELQGDILKQWNHWLKQYVERLQKEKKSEQERKALMDKNNPKYVLRNYMAQLAIDAANKGDYSIINELYLLLKQPYAEQKASKKWFAKRPEWARHKVGCSMLSCSS